MSFVKGAAVSQRESLARNKEMVLQAMKSKGHTARFKSFCKSETMDTFLHACIDYFTIFFEVKQIEGDEAATAERRRDALAEGARPAESGATSVKSETASASQGGLAAAGGHSKEHHAKVLEQNSKLRSVALVYATILLQNSNYANTQQERQFFESLYDFTKRVLFTINNRKHWHAIETELDRIFRSSFFNLSLRKNKTSSQQTNNAANVGLKELYEKSGGAEGFGRPTHATQRSNIHKALLMRSPIISEIFPTPKERAERAAQFQVGLFDAPHEFGNTGDLEHGGSAGLSNSRHTNHSRGRRDEESRASGVGGIPSHLEGEEAMEALVQETQRSYAEYVG